MLKRNIFKNNKQEYWFWVILFLINMLTFFIFVQGTVQTSQALFSIAMMFLCFGKIVTLADKLDEK
tara:strand:+ start:691 stop:888 length:198 start_codon:yes stop_codon:yes gene_type:complete